MEVTPFSIVTLRIDDRFKYHGARGEVYIAPLPEITSSPVVVSNFHVTPSPQVPLYSSADAEMVKPIPNATSITKSVKVKSVFFMLFLLKIKMRSRSHALKMVAPIVATQLTFLYSPYESIQKGSVHFYKSKKGTLTV